MLLQFSLFISNLIQLRKFTFAHDICLSIQVQLLSGLNDILNAKLAKCRSRWCLQPGATKALTEIFPFH